MHNGTFHRLAQHDIIMTKTGLIVIANVMLSVVMSCERFRRTSVMLKRDLTKRRKECFIILTRQQSEFVCQLSFAVTGTHYAYPVSDGQAELTCMAGYIWRWFKSNVE